MLTLSIEDPLAQAVVHAIRGGDDDTLRRLLAEHAALAAARIEQRDARGVSARSLLHVATDWPGHYPDVARTIATLIDAGADVNARMIGPHAETPLHWAASSDDVAALDALLDRGADIEADGAVIANGTPLADAVAFGQWNAARRLIERGARTVLWEAAALGLMNRVRDDVDRTPPPAHDEITRAFWCACHGGQVEAAQLLLERGADINWVGYDGLTPLDAATRSGADAVADWLGRLGARSAGSRST